MSAVSYLSTIDRYHECRDAIRELLASILTGIGRSGLFNDPAALRDAMCQIAPRYRFVDLLYTMDQKGIQSSENIRCSQRAVSAQEAGIGQDRSQRPYFLLARDKDTVVVTEPYLSTASRKLCITAALKWRDSGGQVLGFIVLDIDLAGTVEFLMGDSLRKRFVPAFRLVYSIIVFGLFTVVGLLLLSAFHEITTLFHADNDRASIQLKPFGVIIFLTLGLAVFDLGKTILEEEVLMHKDIFRHSSTRRTITRFIAAILIAVSIEALLMMFKAALNVSLPIMPAVWMMFTAIGLLVGLGVYVYLGGQGGGPAGEPSGDGKIMPCGHARPRRPADIIQRTAVTAACPGEPLSPFRGQPVYGQRCGARLSAITVCLLS